jgi:rod shape-determining protein MreC
MRNVFLFIRRYFNLIFFLALQVASLMMLFRFNKFHEAVFSSFSNEFSGRINSRYNNVETYFTLKKENDRLREQNADLLNRLKADFSWPDSSISIVTDTVKVDSLEQYRKFLYLPAKVISNSVNAQQNYLMLQRGNAQGVTPNMAVVSPDGVVGTIVNVSANMSVVMSMLHRQSKIVAVLKKGSGFGEVTWDGVDPRFVTLAKVAKTVPVNKGDTVVTSQYSDKYPAGHIIGFVETVADDQVTSTYNLKVRTATNFYSIQHAFIVKNLQKAEMDELEKAIKRN